MPPVTKAGNTQFKKDVEFVEKDEDEQIASGIVMVPDKADLQRDFAREGLIRDFSDQFGTFEEADQAGGGIMHAVWPDGWMELERNEVLDESEEIGGKTVEAGSWVQDWKVNNNELWDLVDTGVLEGYSIGAIQVDWDGPYEQDDEEVDDVDTSEVPDGEMIWQLTDGIIREVSAVDIPAVPDAQILEAKGLDKRLAEHIGNQDAFIEECLERGHTEGDAKRLWDVLNEAMETDGASDPGKQSVFAKAGKAFLKAFSGSDDDQSKTSEAQDSEKDGDDFEADIFRVVAPEEDAENYEDSVLGIGVDFPNSDVHVDWRNEVFPDELDEPHVSIYGSIGDLEQATGNTIEQMDSLNAKAAKSLFGASGLQVDPIAKEGRTLSKSNIHRGMAIIDAELDVLQDAGVDHGMTRFTDKEDTDFDLSEHTARDWGGDEDEEEETDGMPFGDMSTDSDDTDEDGESGDGEDDEDDSETDNADTTMSDTTDETGTDEEQDAGEEKSLAEENAEQIGELTAAVETLAESVKGDEGEETVTVEIDGEEVEASKSELEAALGDEKDADNESEEEDVESLKSELADLQNRLETIKQQSGVGSDQIEQGASEEAEDDGGLGGLGKALS